MVSNDALWEAQGRAHAFVEANLLALCVELKAFDETGLFGVGKAHELRILCGFAGASAQSLAVGMVETAAVKAIAAGMVTIGGARAIRSGHDASRVAEELATAEEFVTDNLRDLCKELVAFDETGLFGTGKAHQLRLLCSLAGSSSQSLAIGMVETAAVRQIASASGE